METSLVDWDKSSQSPQAVGMESGMLVLYKSRRTDTDLDLGQDLPTRSAANS